MSVREHTDTDDIDWLDMASAVVYKANCYDADLRDEAVQETALAGWIAAQRWTSDGGMSRRNWIWQAMERGLIDWLRLRLGRQGNRGAWERSVKYLDEPLTNDSTATLGEMLREPDDCFAALVRTLYLDALVSGGALTARERRWVATFLADLPQKALMDEWRVSEARVSQVKRNTLEKLRAAA